VTSGPAHRRGGEVRPGIIEVWETRRPNRRTPNGGAWRGVLFVLAMVVVLIVIGYLAFGSSVRAALVGMFEGNAQVIRIPFVSELLAVELADRLAHPAGSDETAVRFVIESGQTLTEIEDALVEQGLLTDRLAFQYLVVSQEVDQLIQSGTFTMNATMSPSEIVERLKGSPDPQVPRLTLALREGLRIEQIVALLQTLDLDMNVREFRDLALRPPADLRDEYDFLRIAPDGASLEGFMGAGIWEIRRDISADELIHLLLDDWQNDVEPALIGPARKARRDPYEVLILASLVERETGVDAERARVAGVYANRLDEDLNPTRILNADPTVIYARDSMALADLRFEEWQDFFFWSAMEDSLAEFSVPSELRSFQTYQSPGLPATPIATPSRASIRAALEPDRKKGYFFFHACPGSRKHTFARTLEQQQRNIARCP
jgi:UPF0755 protein